MSIAFRGIATGFEINSIIEQMVDEARRPIRRNNILIEQNREYIELWRQIRVRADALQRSLSALTDRGTFQSLQPSATDPSVVAATVTGTSVSGTHVIRVDQLAERHSVSMGPGTVAERISSPTAALGLSGTMMLSINQTVGSLERMPLSVTKDGVGNWLRGTLSAGYHLVVDGNAATNFQLNVNDLVPAAGYEGIREVKIYLNSFQGNNGGNLISNLRNYHQSKGQTFADGVYSGNLPYITIRHDGTSWRAYGPDGVTAFSLTGAHPLGNFAFRSEMVDQNSNILEQHTFDFKIRNSPDTTGMVRVSATDSLNNIAEKINRLNLVDVKASVVRVADGDYRLSLDSGVEGRSGAIQAFHYQPLTTGDEWFYGTQNVLQALRIVRSDVPDDEVRSHYALQTQEAKDAALTLNGLPITRKSNTVNDLIAGVNLTLTGTGRTTLSFTPNVERAQSAIVEFVQAYNDLNSVIRGLQDEGKGILQGTPALMRIERQLRTLISNRVAPVAGSAAMPFQSLASLGVISMDKRGILEIDSAKLRQALETDAAAVHSFFGRFGPVDVQGRRLGADGLARQMQSFTQTLTRGNGVIAGRIRSYERSITFMEQSNSRWERRVGMMESTLVRRFTAMEQHINRMMGQSGFLDIYASARQEQTGQNQQ